MGHLEFQVTGLRSSRQSKRQRSEKQSSFLLGALIAGVILAGAHPRGPSTPAISIAEMPDFGNQFVGVPSPTQLVVIQNSGTDTLQLFSITAQTLEGNRTGDFVVFPENCVKARIEQGASCQIGIAFSPRGVGLRQAKFVVTDNAQGSPHYFSLAGTGLLPPHADARADPTEVDFGTMAVEGKYNSTLTVLNVGDASLSIEDIHFDRDPGPFSFLPGACDHASVPAKASCQMTIAFSPQQPGTYSASISIAHGDAWPLTVPIRGAASGPRHGFCCIGGKIDKLDETTCAAHGGNFSEDFKELSSLCQPPKRQLVAPVPIRPGSKSREQSENLYPCNSIVLSWRAVYDPGETVSYTVSFDDYSLMLARLGQDPWQPYRGFASTIATELTLPNLLPSANPKASVAAKTKTAMMMSIQPPEEFRWQVIAKDSSGNVSPASDWRYFRCQMVIQ
jgi:hypothetical protein